MDGLFKFLSKMELPTKMVFGVIFLFTGIILFGPETLQSKLGFAKFLEQYRFAFGASFLISFIATGWFFVSYLQKKANRAKYYKNRKKRLNAFLTCKGEEADILKQMFSHNMTIELPYNYRAALVLESAGIITHPQQFISFDYGDAPIITYMLQPWAEEVLRGHYK